MPELSDAGQRAVDDLAQRHGFSPDGVRAMLAAVAAGHGGMAQFSHPDFGGSGQWMRGGMTMVGDMFNHSLKDRVDTLCRDLAALIANDPSAAAPGGSFQSQHQGDGGPFAASQGGTGSGAWWPADLGSPNSTGSQNDQRYAYFAQSRRLAIDDGAGVTVYDTGDHQIGGVSQQQSHGRSLAFTSQHGAVDVASLPVVSGDAPPKVTASAAPTVPARAPSPPSQPAGASHQGGGDVFAAIEKLADLKAKGILSDAEFDAKKAELLARL